MKIKDLFADKRIVALAGEKHVGKTNNIVSLIVDYRDCGGIAPIYAYGLPAEVIDFLQKYNVVEISSLTQLIEKKNAILVLDEFQRLKLNDHRHREELNEFVDFVYHNNVSVLLCSPNIKEFNSIIGSKIERWALKTIYLQNCINGSQLKKAILDYKGRYKKLNSVVVPHDTILIINNDKEQKIVCDYVQEADTKKAQVDLFFAENPPRKKTRKTPIGE